MIWFEAPRDRLRAWRDYRDSLTNLSLFEQAERTADWWQWIPLGVRRLDQWKPETWPTPWELVYQADFDENSAALGMAYTLLLTNQDQQDSIDLVLINDTTNRKIKLVVELDKFFWLNYNIGQVVDKRKLEDVEVLVNHAYRDLHGLKKL